MALPTQVRILLPPLADSGAAAPGSALFVPGAWAQHRWLGRVARPLIAGGFGVVFWLGVIGLGLVAPLMMHRVQFARWSAQNRVVIGSVCALVGGLLLRFVVVMAPQYPRVPLWHL